MQVYEDVLASAGRRTYKHRFDPPDLGNEGYGSRPGARRESPKCNDTYGRWVPGGDSQLAIEDIAHKFLDGKLDYDTAVRLTESITDVYRRPCATKRDLLMVLSRLREDHHAKA